jgi:hypothetical protein
MAQTHVQALDLSFQHNQGLFAQAAFLGLQNLTLVETVVDGFGEGVLLRIRHMTTVKAYPLLERSITLINLLLVCENLVVFCLDLLKQVSYFGWSVRHWRLRQHHMSVQKPTETRPTIMHELFEHRCGIFWHMKTHDYCRSRRILLVAQAARL